MKAVRILVLSMLGLGWCAGCHSMPSGTYTSKFGNFTCPVPEMIDGKMKEIADADTCAVSFSDSMGNLLRIESVRLPPIATQFQPGPQQRQGYETFFRGTLMPKMFKAVSPAASAVVEDVVPTAAGNAYFAAVTIPHGSTVESSHNGGPWERGDSFRGVLIFPQHDFLYVISDQEVSLLLPTAPHPSLGERIEARRSNLKAVVATMTFK